MSMKSENPNIRVQKRTIQDSLIVISDSEDEVLPPKKQKVITKPKQEKAKISHTTETSNYCIISSDDDQDTIKAEDNESFSEDEDRKDNILPDHSDSEDEVIPPKKRKVITKPKQQKAKGSRTTETSNCSVISSDDDQETIKIEDNESFSGDEDRKENVLPDHVIKTEYPIKTEWEDYELLSQQQDIKPDISKNIINLFAQGNTIPFIARYRKNVTENMSPESLREAKDAYNRICNLKQKINTTVKSLSKTGQLNPSLRCSLTAVRTVEELDTLVAPYKPESKKTLLERAKKLGLEEPAMKIFNNTQVVNVEDYIDVNTVGLDSVEAVRKGFINIIAHSICSDSGVLSFVRQMRKEEIFYLQSKKSTSKQKMLQNEFGKPIDELRFEKYFDFRKQINFILPHQMLAINRGEHLKILSVKIIVPDYVQNKFTKYCEKWIIGRSNPVHIEILLAAIQDGYSRIIQPLILREIKSDLKAKAEKASYDVFSKNLKNLLLTPPLKGHSLLAIDPGFTRGCKLALVSQVGAVLAHDIIFPLGKVFQRTNAARKLKSLLEEHDCSLIALGNGKGCRETEEWLADLLKEHYFRPRKVKYTIVSEDGASIYSCSEEAKKEFPNLDIAVIGAVSLARRVQDPLAELVKIDPKHLGVGMYQHDLKKKMLDDALNDVVSECVSFVGVDLNTASHSLLKRIAGLTDSRATQIIQHRTINGPFLSRKDLLKVYGIGPRAFQQCAGFLRVGPIDANEASDFYNKPNTTKLDCTYIHPESYKIAEGILRMYKWTTRNVGQSKFINFFKNLFPDLDVLSKEFKTTKETIKLILDTFGKALNFDLRTEIPQVTLFRENLRSISDLSQGTVVTGKVKNVTHFGCFVDIGVERDALIHKSQMRQVLILGDVVEATVIDIDPQKKRISLRTIKKL